MTDPNQDCPKGLKRTFGSCARANDDHCTSVIFPVSHPYTRVCGRASAYQIGRATGFLGYIDKGQDLNGYYVNGLSLTNGSPRKHIWTFASGAFSGSGHQFGKYCCPCEPGNMFDSPPFFVKDDYFCESVAEKSQWDPENSFWDNALWDGKDLLHTCYELNNPPWFYKTLTEPTSEFIELRMCFFEPKYLSNIGIERLEVYVH